jgi:hypothetical protein
MSVMHLRHHAPGPGARIMLSPVPWLWVDPDDEYRQNIQIAELNTLNAALAVIRWKKHLGFYVDLEHEFSSTYTIDGNILINEDQL